LLGAIGGTIAVHGSIVLPIRSGDTAFRAARSVIANYFKIYLKVRVKRVLIAIPLFESTRVVTKDGECVGMEVAQSCTKAGIKTTVIDTQDSILPTYLDKEFTDILEANAAEHGMTFQPNEIVQEITGEDNQASKVVTDKAAYKADMVLIAAGVRPNT